MNAKAWKRGGLCGLDVEAEGGTEEVQKGFTRAVDWTLKRWEAWRKSKTRFLPFLLLISTKCYKMIKIM